MKVSYAEGLATARLPALLRGRVVRLVPPPQPRTGSKIRFNVVLGAQQPRLERRHKRVVAQLDQHRSAARLFHDRRRSSWNQGFLRNPIKVSAALLHIRTGLVDGLPTHLREYQPSRSLGGLGHDFFIWSWHRVFLLRDVPPQLGVLRLRACASFPPEKFGLVRNPEGLMRALSGSLPRPSAGN